MSPIRFWFALFAILGVAITAPAWVYFASTPLDGLPVHIQFLTAMVLPMGLAMMLASWVSPG